MAAQDLSASEHSNSGSDHSEETTAYSPSEPAKVSGSLEGDKAERQDSEVDKWWPPTESLKFSEPVQYPRGCWRQQVFPCAVRTEAGSRWQVSWFESKVVLDSNSAAMIFQSGGDHGIKLLEGAIWLSVEKPIEVLTRYGKVRGEKSEFWVLQIPPSKKSSVRVVRGGVELLPQGSQERLWLREGLENWLGPVEKDGIGSSGVPVALDWQDHIQRWSRLTANSDHRFPERVNKLHKVWSLAAQSIATTHRDLAMRYLASEGERQRNQVAHAKKAEQERLFLLDMFRRRNYIIDK